MLRGKGIGVRRHPSVVALGSLWFLLSLAVVAVGGFAAWAVAARVQPVEVVGGATALFAALLFVAYLTGMGLPVAVARFGHQSSSSVEGMWVWGLAYAAAGGLVGSVGLVSLGPVLLGEALLEPLTSLGFVPAVALLWGLVTGTTWAAMAEVRFLTLHAWGWMLARVVAMVGVRLPLVALPVAGEPLGLFLVMAGPAAVSGFASVALLAVRNEARMPWQFSPIPEGLAVAWRFANVNWLGTLAAQAPQFLAPLIVAANVTADTNAGFYLAWSITTVVFLAPHAIGQVVVSEGSRVPGNLRRQVRVGLALGVGLTSFAALVAWRGAEVVTSVFGAAYTTTVEALPLLTVAAVPWAVTSMCLAVVRVRGDWKGTTVITVGFAALTLVPLTIGVVGTGVPGAAVAWALGNVAAAGLAVVVVVVTEPGMRHGLPVRAVRRRHQVPPPMVGHRETSNGAASVTPEVQPPVAGAPGGDGAPSGTSASAELRPVVE